MRAGALSDASVGEFVNKHFVSAWKRVGTFTAIRRDGKTIARAGGNVAIYFCTPDLHVINVLAGPVGKDALLAEARWAVETYRKAVDIAKDDPEALVAELRKAHKEMAGKTPRACRQYVAPVGSCEPCPDESKPGSPNVTRKESDRPAPPGRTVYHCVPAEELPRELRENTPVADTKAEVVQAVHRVDRQREALALTRVLIRGGRGLHGFLAEQGLPKLDEVYRHIFEGVLGQQVTDQPVRLRELPNGRVYTCQALNAVRTETAPAVDVQDINARLKAALEQIEELKKQVEELKKAQ